MGTGIGRPVALAVALVLAVGTASQAQSLAEVARREQERRKTVKSTGKVYTNDDLKVPPGGTAAAPLPAPPAAPATTPAEAQKSEPAPGSAPAPPAPEDPQKTEAYWRDRITAARQRLERQQLFLDALQSRVNGLWADFTARDDPAQRAVIERDRQKALAEMDRVRAEIDQSTKEIATIEEESRRLGVPPGWLR